MTTLEKLEEKINEISYMATRNNGNCTKTKWDWLDSANQRILAEADEICEITLKNYLEIITKLQKHEDEYKEWYSFSCKIYKRKINITIKFIENNVDAWNTYTLHF